MSYSIKISKEALEDIFGYIKYILKDLENPDGAIKLLHNFLNEINSLGIFPFKSLGIGFHYRGYQIHKKIYKSYFLFTNPLSHQAIILLIWERLNIVESPIRCYTRHKTIVQVFFCLVSCIDTMSQKA